MDCGVSELISSDYVGTAFQVMADILFRINLFQLWKLGLDLTLITLINYLMHMEQMVFSANGTKYRPLSCLLFSKF